MLLIIFKVSIHRQLWNITAILEGGINYQREEYFEKIVNSGMKICSIPDFILFCFPIAMI